MASAAESPETIPINVDDIREIAQSKLSSSVWHYYTTGSDRQDTLERNSTIFRKYISLNYVFLSLVEGSGTNRPLILLVDSSSAHGSCAMLARLT